MKHGYMLCPHRILIHISLREPINAVPQCLPFPPAAHDHVACVVTDRSSWRNWSHLRSVIAQSLITGGKWLLLLDS